MLGDSGCNGKKNLTRIFMLQGYLITVVGLICFIEGIPYLASPEQVRKWMNWLISAKTRHLRILGGVLMVLGLVLVYVGRRNGG